MVANEPQSEVDTAQKTKAKKKGGKMKLTPFNQFMQTEIPRLKQEYPDWKAKDSFKQAVENWKYFKQMVKLRCP